MESSNEVLDFQNRRRITPVCPISQFKDLTTNLEQEMDEHPGNLFSANPYFLPLTQPTKLRATQSTPNFPTQVVKTLSPKINDPSAPPPDLY